MNCETVVVRVPRENVNDDWIEIVEWLVYSGESVEKGQALVEILNSKTTLQVYAPCQGYVCFDLDPGDRVSVGAVLCHVASTPIDRSALEIGSNRSCDVDENGTSPGPRLSRKARILMGQFGLRIEEFGSGSLIREADVRRKANLVERPVPEPNTTDRSSHVKTKVQVSPSRETPTSGIAVNDVPFRLESLPADKRLEREYLLAAQKNTLPSSASVLCPVAPDLSSTAGFDFRAGLCPLVVFEISRLLKKYPCFNAFHNDGQVGYYQEVNIGFAVDRGNGLKVPVVRAADGKDLPSLIREMHELVVAYVNNELTVQDLTGATFTVSDLSTTDVVSFQPLINRGQSAILGVCRFPSAGLSESYVKLELTFDHQLANGNMAAGLLADLAQRLGHYLQVSENQRTIIKCLRCQRTELDLQPVEAVLLRTAGQDEFVCSVCLAGF